MEQIDRERLVRVELTLVNLTELFTDYTKKSCSERGCTHHDDVVSLKGTQKNIRKVSWTFITGLIMAGVGYLASKGLGGNIGI